MRLRRQDDGTFKGSVFVEFVDADSAKQFLDMEDKPKFNERELEVMTKQAYVEGKNQAILEGTVKPKSPVRYGGGNRYNGNRERRNSFQGKRKRENDDEDDDGDKDNWRGRRDKFQRGRDGGGRGRGRRNDSRSRSRSPYQAPKKEEGAEAKDDAKMEDAPKEAETKTEAAETETKTEAKTEEPAAASTEKKDAEETTA